MPLWWGILLPLLLLISGLSVTMTLYTRRDLYLNSINKMFYKRKNNPGVFFGLFMAYWKRKIVYSESVAVFVVEQSRVLRKLDAPRKKVTLVHGVMKREVPWYNFLKSQYEPIAGGLTLPYWLQYNDNKNAIEVRPYYRGPPPGAEDFVILVKDRFNVIMEEITVQMLDADIAVTWREEISDNSPPPRGGEGEKLESRKSSRSMSPYLEKPDIGPRRGSKLGLLPAVSSMTSDSAGMSRRGSRTNSPLRERHSTERSFTRHPSKHGDPPAAEELPPTTESLLARKSSRLASMSTVGSRRSFTKDASGPQEQISRGNSSASRLPLGQQRPPSMVAVTTEGSARRRSSSASASFAPKEKPIATQDELPAAISRRASSRRGASPPPIYATHALAGSSSSSSSTFTALPTPVNSPVVQPGP